MPDNLPQIFGFASNEWHTPWWMARQHLFTRLARRGWPVVYSTGPQSVWERDAEKWRNGTLMHGVDTILPDEHGAESEQIRVDRPGKLLPVWGNFGTWNHIVTRQHARHLLRIGASSKRRKRIAYLWHSRFWPYVDLLKPDRVIFHIHDAWNPGGWPEMQRRYLEQLAAKADIIITTAENMARDLPGVGPGRARILPHGVDFDDVEAGAHAACPEDLAGIPRPRIGYTGRVNLKLDYPLILEVAKQRPHWHWVFVGATGIGTSYSFDARPKVKADWEKLNAMPNVHFLGVKDRRDVPAYLHGLDVLSLPFTDSFVGFPTKLYEYFVSGKPIISWNGENVRSLAHLIELADTPQEWTAAIGRALAGDAPGTPQARKDLARTEDWNVRADTLEDWLHELIRCP